MNLNLNNKNLTDNMINKLINDTFISIEVTPNKGANINNVISKITDLQIDELVDAFSTTDSPLSKLKYCSLLASIKLQQTFAKPSLCTMTMRDRNIMALQSDLLGANDFDIRSIITLTGDSIKIGDHPNAKGVVEGSSLLLLDIIKKLNNQTDFNDNKLQPHIKPIYSFSAIHSYAKNFENIKKRIDKKLSHFTNFFITQPIYDIENAKIMLDLFEDAKSKYNDERKNARMIFGMFPVISYKVANFLQNKVPGIFVSQIWIDKLEKANRISKEEEYKVGFELSYEIFKKCYEINPRIHLMSANNFEIAEKIIRMIKK